MGVQAGGPSIEIDEVLMVEVLSRRELEPSTGEAGESGRIGDRLKATGSWAGNDVDELGGGLSLGRPRRSLLDGSERSVGECWERWDGEEDSATPG